MLRSLFAAVLLLALTTTANATPIKPGINGEFEMFVGANVTLDNEGLISEILFSQILVGFSVSDTIANGQSNDFFGLVAPFSMVTLTSGANPLIVNSFVAGSSFWSVGGFEFFIDEITANATVGIASGIKIIGTLTHDDYKNTTSEFFISGQNLNTGVNLNKTLSASVTSPAPVAVSEPGTLAILALGLMGFAARRKQKSA